MKCGKYGLTDRGGGRTGKCGVSRQKERRVQECVGLTDKMSSFLLIHLGGGVVGEASHQELREGRSLVLMQSTHAPQQASRLQGREGAVWQRGGAILMQHHIRPRTRGAQERAARWRCLLFYLPRESACMGLGGDGVAMSWNPG